MRQSEAWKKLEKRIKKNRRLKWRASGFGCCGRCECPWKFCEGHMTEEDCGRGCFPLCEQCWSELDIEHRMHFYKELMNMWMAQSPFYMADTWRERWASIEKAVLEGK